jgi:hypothetical protein
MTTIGVECVFGADGRVQIRRITISGQWLTVEQGRQWQDQTGRHVLVMPPGQPVMEVVLRADTLTWEWKNGRSPIHPI